MAKFNRIKAKDLDFIPIVSSNINAVKYEEPTEAFTIEFKGGAMYRYDKVAKPTFDAFMSAESQGKYFHSQIKGKYDGVKIRSNLPKPEKND